MGFWNSLKILGKTQRFFDILQWLVNRFDLTSKLHIRKMYQNANLERGTFWQNILSSFLSIFIDRILDELPRINAFIALFMSFSVSSYNFITMEFWTQWNEIWYFHHDEMINLDSRFEK